VTRSTVLMATALAPVILCSCALVQQAVPGLAMTDAEMVGVLNSLSEGEVEVAELARRTSTTSDVQAFAGRVLHEHRQLAKHNRRLAQQLHITPQEPALASSLKTDHEQAIHDLEGKSGSEFDRAYVKYEIARHVRAFGLMETAAESEATLPLREELVRTGPDLLSHLSAARALERRLVAQEGQASESP
jgi:putative membrane protein